MLMERSTFQPGDVCVECQQNGLSHKLRTFYIDIDEQIVKCESSSCLYPYENDLSASEDENIVEEEQRCSAKTTSLPDLDVICFANEYDDADSVRFVEALLSNSNDYEVEKRELKTNTEEDKCQSDYMKQAITLQNNTESTTTSNMLHDSAQSNDAVQTADAGFIEALFSNCEAETKEICESNSSKDLPTLPDAVPTFDMPIITFDFSNNPVIVEQERLRAEKNDDKAPIEIQCIQTVKAGFASTTNEDNKTSVSIKSLELINTEYVKEQPPVQTTTTTPASEQTSVANSKCDDNKVRISRYFDTLRAKQEMFQKTFTKPTTKKRKRRTNNTQISKTENAAGSSLQNVLAVLRNKTQK